MSTTVVTGVSGFLGQRVVAALVSRDRAASVVGVDLVAPSFVDPALDFRLGDVAQAPSGGADWLAELVRGADAVVHLAWSHADDTGSPRDGTHGCAPNLRALRRVLDAVAEAGSPTLVHLSSATVYGAWPDNPVPLAEDAAIRPNPGFSYAVEKAEAERMVAEWAEAHPRTRVVVLRPAATVGWSGPPLYRALAGTGAPRPEDGGRPMQFLHVDDLASAVVFGVYGSLRGVYNVASDGWLGEDAARDLAGGVARVTLPGGLARALAAWGWQVRRSGTPKEAAPYLVHPWVVANDRLRAAGWAPAHTNEEALVATDERSHWSDMPPSRRQEVALAVAGVGVVAAGAGLVSLACAVAARLRRRQRDSG